MLSAQVLKTQPQTLFSRAIIRRKTFGLCQAAGNHNLQKHIIFEISPAFLDLSFKSHQNQTNHILVLGVGIPGIIPQQIRFLPSLPQGSCELETCPLQDSWIFQELGHTMSRNEKKGRFLAKIQHQ